MSEPFAEITALDRLVHEPARLAILTALSACVSADFLYLQRLTGLSKGNLSAQLSKLEEAKLVEIRKTFIGKKSNTACALTDAGQAAIARHWQALKDLHEKSRQWGKDNP